MPDPTTNYNWDKPDVGGDRGRWGDILNAIIDSIDTNLKRIDDLAQGALAKAGGTLTGLINVHSDAYDPQNLGNAISGDTDIDVATGRFFYGVVQAGAANLNFTFSNAPANKAIFIILEIVAGNRATTVTWPINVVWSGGDVPNLSSGTDLFSLYTRNGGQTWRAQQIHDGG